MDLLLARLRFCARIERLVCDGQICSTLGACAGASITKRAPQCVRQNKATNALRAGCQCSQMCNLSGQECEQCAYEILVLSKSNMPIGTVAQMRTLQSSKWVVCAKESPENRIALV